MQLQERIGGMRGSVLNLGIGERIGFFIGLTVVSVMTLLAVIGPLVAPYSPTDAVSGAQLLAPSGDHLFGTDSVGMDVFSRVISAPRTDLTIALLSTIVAAAFGVPLGAVAGYYRTSWSEFIMRVSDLIHSFPVFLLAMAAVIVAGQRSSSLIVVIGFVNAPIYIRLMRAEVLSLRERTFIEAARSLGEPSRKILVRHVLPNSAGPIISQASITIGVAMLLTAGLSFIGAGVRVPTPEWGSMIAIGASHIVTGEWWPSLFPGLALATTVGGFALLGDSLPRLIDPLRRDP